MLFPMTWSNIVWEEEERKKKGRKAKFEVPPLGRHNLQKGLENLKFQLVTDVQMF